MGDCFSRLDAGNNEPAPKCDATWTTLTSDGTKHELRVQVLSAIELKAPEYRLGDEASSFLGGTKSLLSQVYMEMRLGDQRPAKSTPAAYDSIVASGDLCTDLNLGPLLLPYSGEPEAVVHLCDQRNLQAVISGDPPIGEAVLPLPTELSDGQPRSTTLRLLRDGKYAGSVELQCQLLLTGAAVVTASPPGGAESDAQGGSQAPQGPAEAAQGPAAAPPRGEIEKCGAISNRGICERCNGKGMTFADRRGRTSWMDAQGWYDIFACSRCYDGRFLNTSKAFGDPQRDSDLLELGWQKLGPGAVHTGVPQIGY